MELTLLQSYNDAEHFAAHRGNSLDDTKYVEYVAFFEMPGGAVCEGSMEALLRACLPNGGTYQVFFSNGTFTRTHT